MSGEAVDTAQIRAVDPMVPRPVTIQRLTWETDDIFTLHLDMRPAEDGRGEFRFQPGQFNMVYVYGIGEAAISISSDAMKRRSLTHTIHRVGRVTGALAQLKRGDVVGLRGPFGSSWPSKPALGHDVCIVAGGIGLAPLRPLLYGLFHKRSAYGRIILLYGARTPRDLLYRVELEEWAGKHEVEVLVTVDHSDTSWKGHIGVVTSLFSHVRLDARATVAYVCGPETMMKFTLSELEQRGLPAEQIYLSMERNMKCAVGFCGHCQYGPTFICKDGPVFPYPDVRELLRRKEL